MLQNFERVRTLADTDDVLQAALIRLVRALRETQPATSRDFVNFAALQMRRELLDLARRVRTRPPIDSSQQNPTGNSATEAETDDELDDWQRFHEAVEALPVEQREVFGLTYYHGWSQEQIAELFDVDKRTVRRHWRAAKDALQVALKARMNPDARPGETGEKS
jgi:RNA polymerase sigma factor (sigma-70 family)